MKRRIAKTRLQFFVLLMKKKLTMMILFTAITASLIAGCGTKGTGNGNSASQTTGKEDAEDASEFTGTLDEVKDFMFVVTDASGSSYAFTFENEKPEGLDKVKVGDKVTVTYTGTISEVDPFMGEVLSVTAAE